jgi:hypothetical protein
MYVVFLKLKGMCRGFLPQHHNPRAGNLNTSGGQPVHSEASHQSAISYKGVQVNFKCQFFNQKSYMVFKCNLLFPARTWCSQS